MAHKAIIYNMMTSGVALQFNVDFFETSSGISAIDSQTFNTSPATFNDINQPNLYALMKTSILNYASAQSYLLSPNDICVLDAGLLNESMVTSLQNASIDTWGNGVKKNGIKQLLRSGTTSSGSLVVHLTEDGLSTGTALFPNEILYVNAYTNDSGNTYGLSYALSNSNKTLTITANVRSFSSTTVLGISVLGSSSLASAANGTAINIQVIGR